MLAGCNHGHDKLENLKKDDREKYEGHEGEYAQDYLLCFT
jgi:hypothetical protein